MQIIAKDRQTIIDLSLQYLGSLEGAFDIADAFNQSIMEYPQGSATIDEAKVIDINITTIYKKENIKPATL